LLVVRQGVVWIGTSGDGLLCCENGKFSSLKKVDGLAGDFVTALFEDREGSLWVGTRDGLSQITDVKFPIYSSAEGLIGGSCHAVAASPAGGVWAAMSDGISHFDGRQSPTA
jgi:ligand-binding sensor domain-containing protein